MNQVAAATKPESKPMTQFSQETSSSPYRKISGLCPFSFRKFQDGQPVRPRAGGVNYCTSIGFDQWLDSIDSSLAFTSYRLNQLFLLGVNQAGELDFNHGSFRYCMGMAIDQSRLHLATSNQILSFRGQKELSDAHDSPFDHVYTHSGASTVGPLHTHDMVVSREGEIIFVNTNYNCLATLSPEANFKPIWKPSFIDEIELGDRCHLNGLAMVDGHPRYVTAISQSNEVNGWRNDRESGGCVIDIETNEVILSGLSMPHSPRWYNGKLWLHNSGTGEFGYIEDLEKNPTFQAVASCPGFLRGLAFHQHFAIIATSAPRDALFADLAWTHNPFQREDNPGCGLLVVDLESAQIVHWLYLGSYQKFKNIKNDQANASKNKAELFQLYDVQVVPHVKHPRIIRANEPDLGRYLSYPSLD